MKFFKVAIATAVFSISTSAAAYPTKPIEIVVPFTPGGVTDVMTRGVAERLQSKLGQPVVVVNKPGAGTMIASDFVARSQPDGHTLLMGASALGIAPHLYKSKASYDAVKDFSPITLVASVPHVLVVDSKLPVKSVAELVEFIKKNERQGTFASSGNGTSNHLEGELFASLANLNMTHIPFKGSVPGLTALASGDVTMMFVDIAAAKPFMDSGRVRALAVTTGERSSILPDLPTVRESGLPAFEAMPWLGIVAAAGTPDAIVKKLHTAFSEMKQDAAVAEQLKGMGLDPVFNTPAEFATFIRDDSEKWKQVIETAKIKVE